MLTSRLSTQIGVLFFITIASVIALMSWQRYSDIAEALPKQIESEATREADIIASSIASHVLYQQWYPLWSQMRKIQSNYHRSLISMRSFAVVDTAQHVLTHSDAAKHPLMSELSIEPAGVRWSGYTLHVITQVLHPTSNRLLGKLKVCFDASIIAQRLDEAQQQLILFLLIGFLLSALLAYGVRQRVARPLRMLSSLMPRVGTGSILNAPFQHSPREIRQLARAIHSVDSTLHDRAVQANQLAQVIEQTGEMVVITDNDGVIQYVNPAFERVSGYSRSEAIGKTPRIVKSGEHDQSYYTRMWQRLLDGKRWRDDFKNRKKDGSIYTVSQTISPLFNEHGEIEGFAAVQRDITQQRLVEEKIQHSDRVESLGILAGGIAHDFNNLLTAILGNASMASRQLNATSQAGKYLANIESASMSAADLCRQMLAYSGKGQFIVKPLNLSELIESMGKLIEVSISKNIVMRYNLSETLPMIDADVAQLQQIALNFLTNASEAIDNKSGTISLTTGVMHANQNYLYDSVADTQLEPGRYVYLEVSDTGCGMDAATQKKIFDPFFTTKFTGRGLGMSAILGIVKGHKGALRIYSELGQGTSFRVLFPESQTQRWLEDSHAIAATIKGSGCVLIVDDEETIREVASAMLEDMGFSTITANDGLEGVKCYHQHQDEIVFVLLDMTMPKMNGEECFRELRQINPDVCVILSSGYNKQDATNRFSGKGLAGFVQKPYTPQQLMEAVAKLQKHNT